MERTAKTAPGDPWANQTISEALPRVVGFGELRFRRHQSIRSRELETHETTDECSYQLHSPESQSGNTTDLLTWGEL
jgi:hypothetical protein